MWFSHSLSICLGHLTAWHPSSESMFQVDKLNVQIVIPVSTCRMLATVLMDKISLVVKPRGIVGGDCGQRWVHWV